MTQRFTPTLFIALFNVVAYAVLIGFHLATETPIRFVTKWIMPGIDYQDFYQASAHILKGESPYLVGRYVTPPLFAVVNVPLSLLRFEIAHLIFISLIPLMILLSYRMVYQTLKDSDTEDDKLHLSSLLVILFSYPLYFLFERGNIDGIVLFSMCAGLFVLSRKTWLGSLLLAAASLFKLYPVLILVSLFLSRRWKPLLWACGWLLLLSLLTIPYWDDYLALSDKRLHYFRLDENGSLVNTVMIIIVFIRVMFLGDIGSTFVDHSTIYTAALYGLLVVMMFYVDYKLAPHTTEKEKFSNILLYFPFMIAVPQLVYHYEFVLLIPLLPVLDFMWKNTLSRKRKFCITLIAIGISLSQWQAMALFNLTDNMLAYYIPGFGLLIAVIGISIYKWLQLKDMLRKGFLPDLEVRV